MKEKRESKREERSVAGRINQRTRRRQKWSEKYMRGDGKNKKRRSKENERGAGERRGEGRGGEEKRREEERRGERS